MYKNADIVVATMHKKEEAISGPFHQAFNAKMHLPNDFDTDQFGTFTGEVERSDTPYNTVINKAKAALRECDFHFAVANEGSFGPHPAIFLMPADIELISFVDNVNNITVVESGVFPETNYAHLDIRKNDDYSAFLSNVKFGTHGLIIRTVNDKMIVAKGVLGMQDLKRYLSQAFMKDDQVRLETDMRAMMNPTRMGVIQKLTNKLVVRLQRQCRQCDLPGFGKVSVAGNLACELCAGSTELYRNKILSCVKCDYQEIHPRDDGLTSADPKHCNNCNP
tara:strand:+ start:631 stop:1464 length:834 start_codon:yes stop_codon:yes gene_type:complete